MKFADDYPENISAALVRADCYLSHDPYTNTRYIRSRNKESPLTDDEKRMIVNHFSFMVRYPVNVVFL